MTPRNYKDPFAKPELLVALSDPFRALCGFRPVAETRADLAALDDARLAPLLERLTDDDALPEVVAWLVARSPGVDAIVSALAENAAAQGELPHRPDWLDTVARLSAHHPGDPGIAVSALMRTVVLRPGEALYLPAGNIHAYLEGLGLELMEASDNVLRGGLTPKHVDVPELMRVLDARPLPPPLLEPEHPRPGIAVYRPEGVPLSLTVMEAAALVEGVDARLDGPAIVLCLDGAVELGEHGELRRGESALVAEEQTLRIEGPTPSVQPLGRPKDCAAIDISASPVANEIALLLASREPNPGSGDGPSLYYAAEARIGALWCVWTDGSDSMELYLVPGGGWAVDKPGALLPGTTLDVEGADAARWTDSPFVEESVSVVARIGDDLALLGLRDHSVDAVIADDRVDLAGRVLEAFIGSLFGASR